MRRNLRFWTRFTWEYVGAELIMVGIFLLVGLFSSDWIWADGVSGLMDFLALFPFYLIIAAILIVMMTGPGVQTLYIPLLVSCGEPRKNVFWGMQYHRFLMIAATSLICAAVWGLVPSEISDAGLQCLPVIIAVLVIISAFGGLMGAAYVRWKWLGILIILVFFGGFGGLVGWLFTSDRLGFGDMALAVENLSGFSLPWLVAAVAAVLLAVELSVLWLTLRRHEVRL